MYTIITRHAGTDFHYTAENYQAAVALHHALTKTFMRVETWHGATRVMLYDNVF